MTELWEVDDEDGRYAAISTENLPKAQMRRQVHALGQRLAEAVATRCADRNLLFVVVLRGGALLYPSFALRFPEADYCMVGLRRTAGGVVSEYRTQLPHNTYDQIVYLDCIASTGSTLLAAHRAMSRHSPARSQLAVVICSATPATRSLQAAGIDLMGFSLHETETGGIVAPDLGRMDAGDLFAGGVPDLVAGDRPVAP